jgi:hypothetical protein
MQVTSFLSNFNGGARINRFLVEVGPSGKLGPSVGGRPQDNGQAIKSNNILTTLGQTTLSGNEGFQIHIRATKVPGLNVGVIPLNYRGKIIPLPGERQLENWEIIVMDDVDGTYPAQIANNHLHRAFMDWSHSICPVDGNFGVRSVQDAANFTTSGTTITNGNSWQVTQLGLAPAIGGVTEPPALRKFKMHNCWPKEVGPLQFDMSTDGALAFFKVVMAYTHTEAYDPLNGSSWA